MIMLKSQPIALLFMGLFVFSLLTTCQAADDAATTVKADGTHAHEHAASHAGHAEDHAAAHGHAPVDPNPLTINPDLSIVTAVIFVLLLLILGKFAWQPIIAGLDAREQSIANNIEEAQRVNENAKKITQQYEAKLAAAADEVREMLEKARRDVDSTKQRVIAEAQEAAKAEQDRALREIELAKYEALHELSHKGIDLAIELAGQVIHKEIQVGDHQNLIKDALQNFPQTDSLN